MTPVAIVFLVLSVAVVWGGCVASIVFLSRRPEVADYPAGGVDDFRADEAPPLRDS